MRFPLILLWSFFSSFGLLAQEVSTLQSSPGTGYEAIAWSPSGKIYTVDFTQGRVFSIGLDGTRQLLADNLPGPLGAAFDSEDNFYFSGYNNGRIYRIDPTGALSEIGSGFGGPAGILVDTAQQRLFVSDYNNSRIYTLDLTNGQRGLLASGSGLNGPDGIVFAPNGDLLVANFNNNRISRVTLSGTVTAFANLTDSPNSGYLQAFDEEYLIAGFNSHQIWKISPTGTVSVFAGTGNPGGIDGPHDQATFSQPNGLAINALGDSILVTEGATGKIRLITGVVTSTGWIEGQSNKLSPIQISPNPSQGALGLVFDLKRSGPLRVQLFDSAGRDLGIIAEGQFVQGSQNWPLELPDRLMQGQYQLLLLQEQRLIGRAELLFIE
ncbi:MAG: SMP-30/gluconolactonase/LRE family protein [Bacteroidota bacterium]